MAEKPKQPAIPAVPNDVSPSMRNFMTAIREVLQVQAGQGRGSELDKAVTFRDLGLTTGMGSSTAMMGRVLNNLVQNGELVTQQAVERPTTPTGVSVSAFVGGIAISWDNPRYSGHAYTEVFAQPTPVNEQEQPIDPPELNTETMLLGTAASPLLGVQARTLLGYYIWVRHVNRLGQVGPVHNATGTFLYLPPNPSVLLEQLTNQIRADQLTAELMTPINKVPTLEGAVQTSATAIANLNGTYTAQWSAKTQVGDLVGGFGTFNDGTTTRFTVHANRFAIMDSSLGNQSFVPFVVDNGKTVISDAFIRNAYIEQLAAGQITAAKINSLTLNAINITGGTLSLGSGNNMSYQEGGAAGFGKGGPYGGWGSGWHTIIYSNGSIYTDQLYASGGTFTGSVNATSGSFTGTVNATSGSFTGTVNATSGSFTGTVNATGGTFDNVTIGATCSVLGTLNANQIVGDIVSYKPLTLSATTSSNIDLTVFDFYVSASTKNRYFIIPPMLFTASVSNTATSVVYFGSATQCTVPLVRRGEATTDAAWATCDVNFPVLTIPSSGSSTRVRLVIRRNGVNSIGFKTQNCGLLVAPVSTGTFV